MSHRYVARTEPTKFPMTVHVCKHPILHWAVTWSVTGAVVYGYYWYIFPWVVLWVDGLGLRWQLLWSLLAVGVFGLVGFLLFIGVSCEIRGKCDDATIAASLAFSAQERSESPHGAAPRPPRRVIRRVILPPDEARRRYGVDGPLTLEEEEIIDDASREPCLGRG